MKNRVIVLDSDSSLHEGQAVRVEPIGEVPNACADRIHELQRLFAEWTKEDGLLSEAEADLLRDALEQSNRLRLRTPTLD